MAHLQLAQVGCGGQGLRYVYGLAALRRYGFDTFALTALCDLHLSAAEHVACEAEAELGLRPRIYTDFQAMLEAERGLDAVNIVTDTRMHHPFALDAFDAGLHVAVEKPMGVTVRACLRMMEAASAKGRVLSVSENVRRDPMYRLAKALLRGGAVGEPRLHMHATTSGSRAAEQLVAWWHMKDRGGWMLEQGVHTSDLTLYLMGDVERVFAETHLWERTIKIARSAQSSELYAHRVREEMEEADTVEATSEDTGLSLMRFASGAIGQTTLSDAAPGEPSSGHVIYGGEGSMRLPSFRAGRPVQVTLAGGQSPVAEADLIAQVPGFRLDETTARLFGGRDKLHSYDFPIEETTRKILAIELQDFADAITTGRRPEVAAEEGLDAVALSYAILESGRLSEPVTFDDIRSDRVNAYQQPINASVGLQ